MRSRKLLAFILCLITGPALAGYMTLLGAGLGAVQPVAQSSFTNSSYSTNLSNLTSVATFSRVGNAMQFDSSGYLTYGPNNLLTQSNTFSNAAWAKSTLTLTSGQTDPLGGTNATRLTATGATSFIYQNPAFTSGVNAVTTIWVKRISGSGVINLWTLSGGTGTAIVPTGTWAQYAVSGTSSGSAYSGIIIQTSGDVIDIYAATASAVTYETTPRTQDQVITTSAAYYGPRFTASIGSSTILGLMDERAAATNIVLWNRDLTNAAWTKTNVTAAKTQTGIDNTANSASLITATAGNGTVLQSVTLASSQRFQTAYVKRVTGSGVINMTTDGGATWTAITVTASWARVSIPAQTVTNPQFGFQIVTNGDAIAVDYVGNETGASATSEIYTTTAAITRPPETITFTGYASNPWAAYETPIATGLAACNTYANQAALNANVNGVSEIIRNVKAYPVGTSLAALTCTP